MTTPPLGLWVDCPPRRVLGPGYLEQVAGLGFRTIAVMVDRSDAEWSPTWTADQLAELGRRVIGLDLELVLTVWPAPWRPQLEAMLEDLEAWADCGCSAIELDAEHLWRRAWLSGWPSLGAAGDELVERLRAISDPRDIRLELTTHTGHRESSHRAQLSPLVDRVLLQMYSIRHDWQGRMVSWASRLGPGRRQLEGLERGRAIPGVAEGRPRLGAGLALWDQQWPGRTVGDAMSTAWEPLAVAGGELAEVRCWSSKWIVGRLAERKGQKEVFDWLKNMV